MFLGEKTSSFLGSFFGGESRRCMGSTPSLKGFWGGLKRRGACFGVVHYRTKGFSLSRIWRGLTHCHMLWFLGR